MFILKALTKEKRMNVKGNVINKNSPNLQHFKRDYFANLHASTIWIIYV